MRDLTNNRSVEPEQQPVSNPFEDENTPSFESQRQSLGSDDENSHYGKPFNAYNGYYSENGTAQNLLLNHNNSTDNHLLDIGSNHPGRDSSSNGGADSPGSNNLFVPPEYDRYPSLANSRVVSSTSLNRHSNLQSPLYEKHNYDQNGSGMEDASSQTNPFLVSTDFSPFGGYPASSFPLHIDEKEPDDYLHNPDPIADAEYDKNRFMHDLKNMDRRSLGGLIGIICLFIAAIVVFILLPVFFYAVNHTSTPQSYEILTNYEYPTLSAIRTSLIDPDTPTANRVRTSSTGDEWTLVFSDEFNAEGRTFYEDDDQFWNAPDLHYDATKDLEWYDPDAVTTANGTLVLRMDAYKNHDLFYRSGMVQSWNKFCFTQGLLEISAKLPNYGNVTGLWPGLWSMGNLGRPGYMATTEGVWPYSYDSCDAGITPNQSSPDGISYLPGQRLNSCTCKGGDHPNTGVGRGAPEIDVIEGEVDTTIKVGVASQSLQLAPMDIWYMPDYSWIMIHNASTTTMNTYAGGPFQQALSATTTLNTTWYEFGAGEKNFQRYGYEYLNDDSDGYLTWYVGLNPTMTIHANALHADGNIGPRRLSKEPMSLVLNMGISNNWAYIDWASLHFPVEFHIDYVRVYQPEDEINVTCDPADYPTYDYIQEHLNAYSNVNLTSWKSAGYSMPKNKLTSNC